MANARRRSTERGAAHTTSPTEWWDGRAAVWLPAPHATDDKYLRGVLGVRTGSAAYPGASVLGVSAAWRTGVGMVRYMPPHLDAEPRFGLPSPAAAVLAAHPETVFGSGEADAWLIGSGTDDATRSPEERESLRGLLGGTAPVVVDAGALELAVPTNGDLADSAVSPAQVTAPRVLTPHRGEFLRLWKVAGLGARPAGWPVRSRSGRSRQPRTGVLQTAATELASRTGATVLLKGSVSVIATPGGVTIATGPATPWLATAGTGDVLAGILAALVTGHADAVRSDPELLGALAATASVLHDAAARLAAGDEPSTDDPDIAGVERSADKGAERTNQREFEVGPAGAPITASDVAAAIPAAMRVLRAR